MKLRFALSIGLLVAAVGFFRFDWPHKTDSAATNPAAPAGSQTLPPQSRTPSRAATEGAQRNGELKFPKSGPTKQIDEAKASEGTDSAVVGALPVLPADADDLIYIAVAETIRANFSNAALAALDAIDVLGDYPDRLEYLHQLAGWNYEQTGFTDFAIEQYLHALAINPEQRNSLEGLRRLDPQFRENHPPELPAPGPRATDPASDPETDIGAYSGR